MQQELEGNGVRRGDDCRFGAAIEGERTDAIPTSELGAQDAEDLYALDVR